MVRILHVLSDKLSSGMIKQVDQLSVQLDADGYQSRLCSLESNALRRRGIAATKRGVSYCRQSWSFDPTFVCRFGAQLRRINPDIVHWWGEPTNLPVLLANMLHGNRPLVNSVVETGRDRHAPRKAIDWWIKSNCHFVVNHQYMETMMRRRGVSTDRLNMIPNGINSDIEQLIVRSLHVELGLPANVKFVAAMGCLSQEMRFKDLIWSLDLLRVIHPNIHLVIIGEGRYEERLREFVAAVGPSDVVHFLGHSDNINDLLSQSICLWHASPAGCDRAILEAMVAGRPVVAADVPQYRGVIQQSETGFLVPVGDCAGFARKTNTLLNDDALAERYGTAGRQLARQGFSVDAMVAGFVAVYDRAMANCRAAA